MRSLPAVEFDLGRYLKAAAHAACPWPCCRTRAPRPFASRRRPASRWIRPSTSARKTVQRVLKTSSSALPTAAPATAASLFAARLNRGHAQEAARTTAE